MRKLIKYTIFIFYYSIILFSLIKASITRSLVDNNTGWWVSLSFILLLLMFFQLRDGIKIVIFSPRLDKLVVHDSGEYYVRYDGSNYELYKDKILYKSYITTFYSHLNADDGLPDKIKAKLDDLYKEKMAHMKKIKDLYQWDGYTSPEVKRDHRISKIAK